MNKKYFLIIVLILLTGLALRLYHIEFGLPHSFYADEPEISELAIKYTYEFRDIVKNNNYYKLIPISFVYGTFPAYFFTVANMGFSKTLNLLGIGFGKFELFVFLRVLNALVSFLIVIGVGTLADKLFKNKLVLVLGMLLTALNWKLIVHAHYVNADILQTTLLVLSYLTLFRYYKKGPDNLFTVLTGVLFGLAVGTKITTLLTLPLFYYIFLVKKDYRGLAGMTLTALAAFMVSNPFSFILSDRFFFRVMTMFTKEAGMVFDSVDLNPFKYLKIIAWISTPFIFLVSLYGKFEALKFKENKHFHRFLVANVVLYVLFFSMQKRYVERWLLPVLPIVLVYASFGFYKLQEKIKPKAVFALVFLMLMGTYLYFPALLIQQFDRWTPKSEAYLWMQKNIEADKRVLVYTEEGLDPMNKLPNSKVYKVTVYTDEGAQYFIPDNTEFYHYVVISSRPLENYKRAAVRNNYPFYYEKWHDFENILTDNNKFELINQFVLPKPNLIPLSDVYIYKNLGEVKTPILIDTNSNL